MKETLGSFTLIRNENQWIAGHLEMWLPILDKMCFFDGNSTDGTLEIIDAFHKNHKDGNKINLVKDKDPKNLQDDYVKLFNEAMWSLDTGLATFLHPDMLPVKTPANFDHLSGSIAAFMKMRSFAGNPDEDLFEIKGRGEVWKNIYRLHSPNIGAHYHGHYGAADEDVYFTDITGSEHDHHGQFFNRYPYPVEDSGLEVLHFSDVRDYARRLGRMKSCLINQGYDLNAIYSLAETHPRVTLKEGHGFSFVPSEYPAEFLAAKQKYQHLTKEPACV